MATQTTELVIEADSTPLGPLPLNKRLEREFHACGLVRPFRRECYDPGDRLEYEITGVIPANTGRVVLEVERFLGGGFAGQVYRAKLLQLDTDNGPIVGLAEGQSYAVKILTPPSRLACAFRDTLYFLAYQGQFSARVNPAAVRVGVLWQKLIRRAVAVTFGDEDSVCDTYATFHDHELHSFGEINEWVEGRIWKFEADPAIFRRWRVHGQAPGDHNCPEYLHKKRFMQQLVALLDKMGAPELARQYEWWTCKSQPNVLKRLSAEDRPESGLTAIDFRPGLALLPVLPMSPADVGLILRGLIRGRWVQFDRSDPAILRQFIEIHRQSFEDMQPAIEELREQESAYRASLVDVTGHHLRLLTDARLRRSVKRGFITAWKHRGWVDDEHASRLEHSGGLFCLVLLISLFPLLGRRLVKLWGDGPTRQHVKRMFSSAGYLGRAWRASRIETLIEWHRQQRACDERVLKLVDRPVRFWLQLMLFGWMPASWHRFLGEPAYAWTMIGERIAFTVNFLRLPSFRDKWLLEQVQQGQEEGMLTPEEADKLSRQVQDPFIQRYLRCLAVHLCTFPVTKVVMVLVGIAVSAYWLVAYQAGWEQAVLAGTAAAALIQLLPVSPGSITRGAFVLSMMIKDRDVRNYCIAAPISFLHGVGYLAFPLQMSAHGPAFARFLAGRWVKNLVHFVPIFGEPGGLLEHIVFDLSFNLPLSVGREFRRKPLRWTTGTAMAIVLLAAAGYWSFVQLFG